MKGFFVKVGARLKRVPQWLLVVVGVLVVVRIFLPSVCLWTINRALDSKLGVYKGHIEDFDLSLYRGAYQIEGLRIEKREGQTPPILEVKEIDLSLAWRAVLKKNISADVTITEMKVKIADAESTEKKQTGAEEPTKNWESVGTVLVPISIETLILNDSAVYFTNNNLKTPVPVALEKINLEAKDLRSRPSAKMSPIKGTALLQGHADIWTEGSLDLLAEDLRLDLDFKIEKFRPQSLNQTLRLYVPVDITHGEASLYGEVAAQNGRVEGYGKLFLRDGDIIAPAQDYLGIKHFFIEIATAFANWLLQNNQTKNIAMKIPFHYDQNGLDIDASEAFWSAVKNRTEDLKPELENSVSLKNFPGTSEAGTKGPAGAADGDKKELTPEERERQPGVERRGLNPTQPARENEK